MRLRYKDSKIETFGNAFNLHSLDEILTHDDSVPASNLDVFIPLKNEWKDLRQAFRDKDVLPNDANTWFAAAVKRTDKSRGYFL